METRNCIAYAWDLLCTEIYIASPESPPTMRWEWGGHTL